jgi:hypothetical protein
MSSLPPILASDDYEGMIKLIGFVIVLIIWAVGAMVSTIRKAQAKARQKQARAPVAPPLPAQRPIAGPARPPAIPPRIPMALPPLPTLARAQPPARAAARPKPAVPVQRTSAPAPPPVALPRPKAAPVSPAVASSSIAGLFGPTTVRAQFILAEVLQPPLALRTKRTF